MPSLHRFMDEIQEKVDGIEEEATIVKDLYDLIDAYKVPASPEDIAVYQVRGQKESPVPIFTLEGLGRG